MAKRKRGTGAGPAVSSFDEGKWRAQSDHRTLTEAAEIHGDSSRMAGVRNHQVEQVKGLKKMDKIIGDGSIKGRKTTKP